MSADEQAFGSVNVALQRSAMKQWRWMLAISSAIALGALIDTVFIETPRYPLYMHLLVTYHFGFVRRALVGEIVSLFTDVVHNWYVYAIAVTAWATTLVLFIAAFRKIFGFNEKNFSLFVFMAGSPFFFKNFAIAVGFFDIYGCLWALVALLIPVNVLYPLIVAIGCVGLILIHHLHFLLYIPTICFIVFVRYAMLPGLSTGKIVYGGVLVLLISCAFVATAFCGRMPVPHEVFLAYVRARAADRIDPGNAWAWYSTFDQELNNTWSSMGLHASRFPAYAVLIGLHLPIWRYLKSLIVALSTAFSRMVSIAALTTISVGYLIIGAVIYDYSRWVSSWAVCMFLALHAIRLLPSVAEQPDAPIPPARKTNLVLGWILTAIPRVGVTNPF